MTVIEDMDEVRLVIVGEGEEDKLPLIKNQSIIGICQDKSGKTVKVPGIDVALSIFGNYEYYSCLSQTSDPEDINRTSIDGVNISYQ